MNGNAFEVKTEDMEHDTMAASEPAMREDDQRARELYHYFQPDNPALLPLSSRAAVPNEHPSPSKESPNLVLTALAQLAALRLGAQRAIISLIDRETLFVVAEASRSLNLGNNDIYQDDGDGLWMGCSQGPVAGTLCEKTVTLQSTPEKKYPLFVVQDLREHSTFRNIPCVCGPPHFRFYAGTPLTTANGINIGSLYVIDPRPNLPLTPSDNETLGILGDAVMEYLETSRQSLEGSRLAKVLSGLNSFVQGENSEETLGTRQERRSFSDRVPLHVASPRKTPKVESENLTSLETSDGPSVPSSSPADEADISSGVDTSANFPLMTTKSLNKEGPVLPPNTTSDKISATFQRAANIMRESLDLGQDGGVIIFDSSDHLGTEFQDDSDQEKEHKPARIRAMSSNNPNSILATQLDLNFTRRMLRRYPHGGLWYFYQDGTVFSSDDDTVSSGGETKGSDSSTLPQESIHPQSYGTLREKDLQSLKKYFPNATRIIFAPLWDSFNSRWFGGCFCWSSVETRVFSAHVELGGVFGFGSSLMVEHSRAQSQESDRKKGDFISSISHELRSPLHGILAATGFLSEHVDSEFGRTLLDTIRACGQTLLDTFEQILDFTKINSFEKKRQKLGSPRLRSERGGTQPPESLHILKVVNVAAVVEEVIESVYSGQVFTNNLASGAWHPDASEGEHIRLSEVNHVGQVDVFVDFAPIDWEFLIEPGALRRIVMNVFGNALKYTEEGHVSVRLEIQKKATNIVNSVTSSETEILLLTVSDTGRGISNEYLRNNIFTPFSQEDPLSPGTGLGLSLVRSILRSLNGNIKVKSQIGSGTIVTITLPLARPQQHDPSLVSNPESVDIIGSVRKQLEGKSLHLLPTSDAASYKTLSSLLRTRDYLIKWFGLRLKESDPSSPSDLILVKESQLDLLPTSLEHSLVLVLCDQGFQLRSSRTGWDVISSRKIQVTLPCGPYRLARRLLDSLKSQLPGDFNKGFHDSISSIPSDPQQNKRTLAYHTAAPTLIHNSSAATPVNPGPDPQAQSLVDYTCNKKDGTKLPHPNATSPGTPKDGLRLLLVEDNPINLALLRKFITRKRPQVLHTAVNGAIAVQQVQTMTEGYHYIFMDMSMPVMDGFEATQAIRSIERDRQTAHPSTIIALTGLGSSEHITKAYAAGVNVFLTKPVSFVDIDKLMGAVVED